MFIYIKEKDEYIHLDFDSDIITNKLEKGIYNLVKQPFGGYSFTPNKSFEKGKIAEAGIFQQVNRYVDRYFSKSGKLVRKLMNNQTRLGLFFKGQPGTGKTFMAAKLALKLIEKEDGVCIYTTNLDVNLAKVVDAIRTKDPDKLVVFILDEFEKDYENLDRVDRNNLLSFLDGGNSRNNVVVIATANSLNGIPSTLLERPGRFEKIVEFKITDNDILGNLVYALIPEELSKDVNKKVLLEYVKSQQDMTIDKLKSIVRDALTSLLETGKMFNEEHDLKSMDKEVIKQESSKKKKKKKKPGVFSFLPSFMSDDEEDSDE